MSCEYDTDEVTTGKLVSIFHPTKNLGSYNIKSMVILLKAMMKNFDTLFEVKNSIKETRKSKFEAIEDPPIFSEMVPFPVFKNEVMFPREVVDRLVLYPRENLRPFKEINRAIEEAV